MEIITEILQTIVNGLVIGSVISVAAVGFTLSYGITRFINFAYGEYITLGPFLALSLAGVGLGLPLRFLVAVIVSAVIAIVISRLFYAPVRSRGPLALLITSVGISFILQNGLVAIFGSKPHQFDIPLIRSWTVVGVKINPISIGLVVAALVTMLCIHLTLSRTMLGKKMRAMSNNRDLAQISGIDVERTTNVTWALSGGLAGIAGLLASVRFAPFNPLLGWDLLLVIFAATILGGIGKPYGAMIGSLIIGLVMSAGSRFLASEYTFSYAFVVLAVILLFYPRGIRGGDI